MTDHVGSPRHLPQAGTRTGRHGWRRWLAPLALALGAAAAGAAAVMVAGPTTASPIGAPQATTPLLSARRAPDLLAAPVGERRLVAELEAWVAQSPPDTCLQVERSGSDRSLVAMNATQPLPGASTQKLVTATALLLAHDPDARFETVVAASTQATDGVLAGDLYLIGGGDPLLTTPQYAVELGLPAFLSDAGRLVDVVSESGIRHIAGSVIGDETRYDSERFNPIWPERFRPQNVAGPVGALQVNDGLLGFPKDGSLGAALEPPPDPAAYAAAVVTQLLRERGITVDGPPQSGQAPGDATTLGAVPSAPMRQIVAHMLAASDNHTAEMAFKELGVRQRGEGSWEAGSAAAEELLTQSDVALDGARIVDGSGLSTENRLTCQLLVDLLTRPETGPVLANGLAVAGESGTLEERWNDTPIEGRLRAKTGSVRRVTALSGQASPRSGGPLTFAYVATVPPPQQISDAVVGLQDGLADILISYPRNVDMAALMPADVTDTTG